MNDRIIVFTLKVRFLRLNIMFRLLAIILLLGLFCGRGKASSEEDIPPPTVPDFLYGSQQDADPPCPTPLSPTPNDPQASVPFGPNPTGTAGGEAALPP